MNLIAISTIKVSPNRQRRLFDPDKLHEFADGIKTRGLLHPIILRVVAGEFYLVAGERRLRACNDIAGLGGVFKHDGAPVPPGMIPYTLFDDLDPLAAEEAELEENTHRQDLTWQERAAAHSRLDALRAAQAAARGEARPTVTQLAEEVRGSGEGINRETTRRELIVAKHLHNPAVAAAKNVDEAFKLLKRAEASERNKELGEKVGRTFTADAHTLVNGDSLAWMTSAAAEQFDVILTDPPYGMGADEFGDSGGLAAGAHGYKDTFETWQVIIDQFAGLSFQLAKPQAHLYVFLDIANFDMAKDYFAAAGWQVFRTPLIWYKRTGMRAPWPEWGPQRKYETILYAIKGKRPTLKMAGDVLDFPPDANLGHAAQKPVALFQELLSRSILPGQSVLDPFMGTGPILAAAHALKCRATGIELDQASYGIAVKRLSELRAQQELDLSLEMLP